MDEQILRVARSHEKMVEEAAYYLFETTPFEEKDALADAFDAIVTLPPAFHELSTLRASKITLFHGFFWEPFVKNAAEEWVDVNGRTKLEHFTYYGIHTEDEEKFIALVKKVASEVAAFFKEKSRRGYGIWQAKWNIEIRKEGITRWIENQAHAIKKAELERILVKEGVELLTSAEIDFYFVHLKGLQELLKHGLLFSELRLLDFKKQELLFAFPEAVVALMPHGLRKFLMQLPFETLQLIIMTYENVIQINNKFLIPLRYMVTFSFSNLMFLLEDPERVFAIRMLPPKYYEEITFAELNELVSHPESSRSREIQSKYNRVRSRGTEPKEDSEKRVRV